MGKMHARGVFVLVFCAALFSGCARHDQHSPSGDRDSTNTSQVQAVWKFSSQTPQSGQNEQISIQIQDNTGKPIEKFKISHEKQMHLIIVSKDLSFFNHIHPDYKGNGVFQTVTRFPFGGDYKLIADFIPEGAEAKTESQWITVGGNIPPQQPLAPETDLTKTADGKEVTLTFDRLLTIS